MGEEFKQHMMRTLRLFSALALVTISSIAADVRVFDTLADLAEWNPNPQQSSFVVRAYDEDRPFANHRPGHYDASSVLATNLGCVFETRTGVGRNVMDDCEDAELDVRLFGAIVNGATDDWDSVQGTINYVGSRGGGIVRVPPGTTAVTETLTNHYGASFIGAGHENTGLKRIGGGTGPLMLIAPSGFINGPRIEGIRWDCGDTGEGLIVTNASRIAIQWNRFTYFTNYGVKVAACNNGSISHNWFVDARGTNSVGLAYSGGGGYDLRANRFNTGATGVKQLDSGSWFDGGNNTFEFNNVGMIIPMGAGGGNIFGEWFEFNTNGHLRIGEELASGTVSINERTLERTWSIYGALFGYLTPVDPGDTNTPGLLISRVNGATLFNNTFTSRLKITSDATNTVRINNKFPMWRAVPAIDEGIGSVNLDEFWVSDPNLRPYVTNIWPTPNYRWGKYGDMRWNLERNASVTAGFENRLELDKTAIYWDGGLSLAKIATGIHGWSTRLALGDYPQSTMYGRLQVSYPTASAATAGTAFLWSSDAAPSQDVGGVLGFGGYYGNGSDPLPANWAKIEGFRYTNTLSTASYLRLKVRDGSNAYISAATFRYDNIDLTLPITLPEQTSEPATPPPNSLTIYASDNGSGKTVLVVKWSSGLTNVIETMP